jgi:hypothetical protein
MEDRLSCPQRERLRNTSNRSRAGPERSEALGSARIVSDSPAKLRIASLLLYLRLNVSVGFPLKTLGRITGGQSDSILLGKLKLEDPRLRF